MLNLIPRFYDVTGGKVTIDGHDVRDVTLASLRHQIALVTQEPFLFDDTIRANIAYAKDDATQAEIEAAARQAAAHDFIMALPKGYDTPVGEAGARLSGGQRQRIAIARAFLKDAPILLLDEATSALDTESEAQVQAALERLMAGRTTILIAHRLSTVRGADRIYVIDRGQVVEDGDHGQLVGRGGLYARLAGAQDLDRRAGGGRVNRSSSRAAPGSSRRWPGWCRPISAHAGDDALALREPRGRGRARGRRRAAAIGCFWHGRIALAVVCRRVLKRKPRRVLISNSPDGELIAKIGRAGWAFPPIRGSSTMDNRRRRRSVGGVPRGACGFIDAGGVVAITPDGPRGPAEEMPEGPVMLARAAADAGVPVRPRRAAGADAEELGQDPDPAAVRARLRGLRRAAARLARRRRRRRSKAIRPTGRRGSAPPRRAPRRCWPGDDRRVSASRPTPWLADRLSRGGRAWPRRWPRRC